MGLPREERMKGREGILESTMTEKEAREENTLPVEEQREDLLTSNCSSEMVKAREQSQREKTHQPRLLCPTKLLF
jgi:hypothetical protein